MRKGKLFVLALGVGTAAALAPMAVDAAKRSADGVALDKKARAKVVVANRPAVKVPGGVKVTNEPSVKVPGGVAVTNQPTVSVGNEPTVRVANQPTTITARPPLEKNFNLTLENVTDVVGHALAEVSGSERVAITEVTISVQGAAPNASLARLYTSERKTGSSACSASSEWSLPKTLRSYVVGPQETLQLDYSGAPLVIGSGGHTCLAFQQTQWWADTKMHVGVSGFYFDAG